MAASEPGKQRSWRSFINLQLPTNGILGTASRGIVTYNEKDLTAGRGYRANISSVSSLVAGWQASASCRTRSALVEARVPSFK